MPKIVPTENINYSNGTDEVEVINVSNASSQVQQLVELFDEWRQKEADAQSELLCRRAALRDIQREMFDTIIQERQAAAQAAEPLAEAQPSNYDEAE